MASKNQSRKKKKTKGSLSKANIQELHNARDGGQIAIRGYSYQFLYSCYLILSSLSSSMSFQLEGIEDIDCIKQNESDDVTHIQLKYSVNKQDASFLSDVLKNFLEAYLLDHNRNFKLVYDFPVAKGNLSKILTSNLDKKSRDYWISVISNIMDDYPDWNWSKYNFDEFMSRLSFEKVEKATLETEIERTLIKNYGITAGNVSLFTNSIKIICLTKMEQRACVTKAEIDNQIQLVKIDISKGVQNPANSWIRKLDFSTSSLDEGSSYYEGKKATPSDIVGGFPIKRPALENDVMKSINDNTVTVIKASSGQGKTTLALQVAYGLQNQYTPYQLLWCDEIKEIGHSVDYFKSRIQLGENILILIDNLDNHLSKWNYFAQQLQSEVRFHYKLLVTSRENDWYHYSGDLSKIHSLNIIKPVLEEDEAFNIFNLFKEAKHLHPSVVDWKKAWNRISEKQLLIEYVYLLTHGEMLSERIASQISVIGQSPFGNVKCDILRRICFADICGISLSIASIVESQSEPFGMDLGEMLKSMESEFFIRMNEENGYIEGLHPIRSRHIIEKLHEYYPLDFTAISVITMADKELLPVLFSHLPEFNFYSDDLWSKVIDRLWNLEDLSKYVSAIEGLFSGSVMQYYQANQTAFNDANIHDGLFIISTEICPFTRFKEFNVSVETLNNMRELFPDNKNIEYLCELRDSMPICDLRKTLVYTFCERLYEKLKPIPLWEIKDLESYASIAEWLYNIDTRFNLTGHIALNDIWDKTDYLTLECVSTLMYVSYLGNKKIYMEYVANNLHRILIYLKHQTKSHKIYIDFEKRAIHVEYILRLREINTGNEQSVQRLKYICRILPIYETYCADALKPTVDLLSIYKIPDDAHKAMPIKNIVITFHQNIASLWNKTIMSNYEFDTVTEWLTHWFEVRECVCSLIDKCCACMYKILEGKKLNNLSRAVYDLREKYEQQLTGVRLYPKEDRPFEEKATVPDGLDTIKSSYFQSIRNYMNMFVEFLLRDEQKQELALINLTKANSALIDMQRFFEAISNDFGLQERHSEICVMESDMIERIISCSSYYQNNFPNEYFDRYQIKKWFDKRCYEERKKAEDGLAQLQYKYRIHFPNRIYTRDVLRYYPIIVENLNLTSNAGLAEWLCGIGSFANTSFDYLVILTMDEFNVINPNALLCSRQFCSNSEKAIESGDYEALEKSMTIFPVPVTNIMISCFEEKFLFHEPDLRENNDLSVGDVAEELWVYSKSRELLCEPEDLSYLESILENIRATIDEVLFKLKSELSNDDIEWIKGICRNVFEGEEFDNRMFNEVIEYFNPKNSKE